MKFKGRVDLEGEVLAQEGPHTVIVKGAFGTGKKTVPLYSAPEGDPKRRVIGQVEVDLDTGEMEGTVEDQKIDLGSRDVKGLSIYEQP